jgi:ATP-dependent RNA helicase RhlE
MSWEDLKLTRQFIDALQDLGYKHPTLIQQKCIPPILAGQKVVGIAQTGTGKTAAYLVPLLYKLKYGQGNQPRALILAPTKELVIQIASNAQYMAKYTDIKVVCLYGGVGQSSQVESLRSGADMIVATPGRFMEIYLKNEIQTKQIKLLVIDEADKMMDMNFMPQLRKIFEVLPPKRQDLLFSATFPHRVEKMISEFIDFPVRIEASTQSTVTKQVTQSAYKTPNFKTKLNLLLYFLKDDVFHRVLIFARTKQTVINLAKYLERSNVESVKVIHSNKSQNARINSITEFREGKIRILISTDVSARGIDIKKVSHVINFDVPLIYEDYVHRIGRTGRAFETGMAITFVTPSDIYHVGRIEKMIGDKINIETMPSQVIVEETPFEESQQIAREIDRQKRKEDPEYKGAFHDRK